MNAVSSFPLLPNPYKILKQIGSGSFGNVYLAENSENGKYCVVKELYFVSQEPKFMAKARDLFRQEAETLAKLSHPQIPHLITHFEENNQFYLVQDYIEGHTLKEELQSNFPFSEKQTIELLVEGLSVIGYVHKQGIIHRDIKPDNFIRRQQDSKFVLIDFGAVKEFNLEQTKLINPTVAIGTRGYMPTEQARGKPRKNSDIYALGMIAIQAITGMNPLDFKEDEEGEIIWQTQAQVKPELAAILSKMVRYHYKNRYQSADEALNDLSKYFSLNDFSYLNVPQPPTINPNYEDNSSHLNINSPPVKELNDDSQSLLTSTSSQPEDKNSWLDWFKTPLGSTVTTAMIIGLLAMVGAYMLSEKEKKDKLAQQQTFLNDLKTLEAEGDFEGCFNKIEETIEKQTPEDKHLITNESKAYSSKCRLGQAQKHINNGEDGEALSILAGIDQELGKIEYQQAEKMINNLSRKIFNEAQNLYEEQGDFEGAREKINLITDRQNREKVRKKLKQWEDNYKQNTYYQREAEKDLLYENCQEVINTASKMGGTNYWRLEGKQLVDKAAKCFKDTEQIRVNPPIAPPINPPPSAPCPPNIPPLFCD